MPLTMQEFENGIAYWRNRRRWPSDFHNGFYERLGAENPNGDFHTIWWQTFLGHLKSWRATRPVSGADLTRNAVQAFPALGAAWRRACAPYSRLDIISVAWAQVEEFPAVVRPIKPGRSPAEPVRSPVFMSKFCHFLVPGTFPVVDNAAMGLPFGATYRAHFEGVQQEWAATPVAIQQDLHAALTSLIAAPLVPNYPLTNKVVEVCLIGRRNG